MLEKGRYIIPTLVKATTALVINHHLLTDSKETKLQKSIQNAVETLSTAYIIVCFN